MNVNDIKANNKIPEAGIYDITRMVVDGDKKSIDVYVNVTPEGMFNTPKEVSAMTIGMDEFTSLGDVQKFFEFGKVAAPKNLGK